MKKFPKKNRYELYTWIIFCLLTFFILGFPFLTTAGSLDYNPMENLPGFGSSNDFGVFISNLYKFGIWTVGICALLMIVIGGYFYAASGGNNATMQKAKGFITDAIIGLILALLAYLILYIINPELVKIKTSSTGSGATAPSSTTNKRSVGNTGSGLCKPTNIGPCSVENLKKTCFGEANAEKASAICMAESGGKELEPSKTDKCQDGNVFSYGLFQVNLTCQCPKVFSKTTGKKGCADNTCKVIDSKGYEDCKNTYTNASNNINKSCSLLYNTTGKYGGWNQWGANSKCKF